MKALDLNGNHLGQRVTVQIGHATITDVLSGVQHEADLIMDEFFGQAPSFAIGRRRTALSFLAAGDVTAYEDTVVELHEHGR